MALDEEQALELLKGMVKEAKLDVEIRALVYREDYQDYVIVIGDVHYSDIREKLISDYVKFKNKDIKREILYKLTYPMELEEWQKEEFGIATSGNQPREEDIPLDKSGNLD